MAYAKAAFNAGYIIACCNIVHAHNEPDIAADIIGEIGPPSRADILAMDLTRFDLRALVQMKLARPQHNLFKKEKANAN